MEESRREMEANMRGRQKGAAGILPNQGAGDRGKFEGLLGPCSLIFLEFVLC